MSKFDDVVKKAVEQLAKVGIKSVDETLLRGVAKSQGPSIYLRDASMVSCSDQSELDRVINNFVKRKLNVTDDAKIDKAIKATCATFKPVKQKMRVAFYYVLVKELGKEEVF
jgi:hypothetical protein